MSYLKHPKCGKSYPSGSTAGHCSGSGLVAFPLWPATITGADLNTAALEQSPDGGSVGVDTFGDHLRSVSKAIQPHGFIPIDAAEFVLGVSATPILAMLAGMFLGGKNAEVARIVIGSVSVDVVDVLAAFRSSDDAVLVCLDVLSVGDPAKADVPLGREVTSGRSARWYLSSSKHPNWLSIRAETRLSADVTPPTLLGGTGDNGLAIDADNVHALSLQWFCCETFIGLTAFEAHRRGEHGVDRHCEITDKHWTDDRGFYHVGPKLTDEQKAKMWPTREATE